MDTPPKQSYLTPYPVTYLVILLALSIPIYYAYGAIESGNSTGASVHLGRAVGMLLFPTGVAFLVARLRKSRILANGAFITMLILSAISTLEDIRAEREKLQPMNDAVQQALHSVSDAKSTEELATLSLSGLQAVVEVMDKQGTRDNSNTSRISRVSAKRMSELLESQNRVHELQLTIGAACSPEAMFQADSMVALQENIRELKTAIHHSKSIFSNLRSNLIQDMTDEGVSQINIEAFLNGFDKNGGDVQHGITILDAIFEWALHLESATVTLAENEGEWWIENGQLIFNTDELLELYMSDVSKVQATEALIDKLATEQQERIRQRINVK